MIIPVGPARNLASQEACSSRVGFPLRSMLGKKNKPSPGKELRSVETILSSLDSRVKPIPLSSTMCETPPQRNMVTPPARVAISHLYRNFIRSSVPCVQDSNLHAVLFPICHLASLSFTNPILRSLAPGPLAYGQPACGAGAPMVNTRPVRSSATSRILSIPRHSAATMNNVLRLLPPSIQAKHPRSTFTVCRTAPPSRTRTQRLLGTSAYQTALSASMQMPSGTPPPRSAQTRRFDRLPSRPILNAVSFLP